MIIYSNTKGGFINDCKDNLIAQKIEKQFLAHNIAHDNDGEYRAWKNSLQYMRNVLDDNDISDECNIAIEYQIPLTSKRVDFLLAGMDDEDNNNVVVVELKQWEDSGLTSRADVVTAFTGGANRAVAHPSYQAYSYAKIIENFNEDVYKRKISLIPCAYLHNYKEKNRDHIANEIYQNAIELSPVFLEDDTIKLRNFIKKFVKKKDNIDLLMKIDNGKLKPSKALQDSLASMLKGNREFYLIDEQKVVYETVKKLVEKSIRDANRVSEFTPKKSVVIVEGGPGTGKSVVAIQLLCDLIQKGYSANYVTKNAAPRNVYFEKLKQNNYKLNYIKSLFRASDFYYDVRENTFDCLIVDEAHRLRKKSRMFYGENQIKEIINASRVSVFFIDNNQKITTKDIGSVDEIKKWAEYFNANLFSGEEYNLISQFRCNGSDGYLAFLDNLLEIRQTANYELEDYEIRLFNDPNDMREALREKNKIANKSRMVAGYCYEWVTQNNPKSDLFDINLENDFHAKWNFSNTSTWAIDEDSFDEVGCIHTSQGLEFDYCGVIIGNDLTYINNKVTTNPKAAAESDKSSGIKHCKDLKLADELIRNTYKVLLSRAQKGTFIYCEDKELLKYISKSTGVEIE